MRQIIKDYSIITEFSENVARPMGDSTSPKSLIFHILENNSDSIDILDIGFGTGGLGRLVKAMHTTNHWQIDGIDGWQTNCENRELFDKKIYRNVWHGFAQELPSEIISKYKIICLLDVIEHLNVATAKWLFRTLLTNMGDNSFLFVSTPLWFYPQAQQQDGDLEEHLIGVPASSMLALIPKIYSIGEQLVGGFVYGKDSLNYIDFFEPTSDKNFTYEMGLNILRSLNVSEKPGILYKLNE